MRALSQGRTQVVFGNGHPDADLMFVGEAPGFHEDQQGIPFVGQAGKLLDRLLEGIGLTRADVYVANTLKCRPPGNRDPLPEEKSAVRAVALRADRADQARRSIATLGNHATKQLTGKETGITRVHGQPQQVTYGAHAVTIFPIYHPAAALYTPAMLKVLEEDFAKIPALIEHEAGRAGALPRRGRAGARAGAGRGTTRPVLTELETGSPEETEALAARVAVQLAPGDVVAVSGELGSGKTTFVRGACRALGVTGPVTSPTYTIGHRYEGSRSRLAPRPVPLRRHVRGRLGRARAVLRRRDRLRRVARGGRRGAARAAPPGTVTPRGRDAAADRPRGRC